MTASATIAAFAARAASFPFSDAQRHLAYRAFLDTVACAIAGRSEDAPRLALEYAGASAAAGSASVWGTKRTMAAEFTAWANGITGHVLDYDDVMTPMRGHISVILVPALAALAQMTGANGRQYSSAYIVGFDVLTKLAKAMALPHYAKGWHSTSSLGVLGATAACGALLGLNETQIEHALGLAVAQAGGSRQNFGTMAKSFQAGQCNAAAVRAALLAKSGYTASADAIDGAFGYLTLYAEKENVADALSTLGKPPFEIDATGIDVKKYACCYANHKALDGILALRREHKLTLDQVQSVDVLASSHGLEALLPITPMTGLQGKFSMEYVAAAALLDGAILLSSFSDDKVMRPQVRAFMPNVSKRESDGPILPRWVQVTLRLKNGKTLEQRVDVGRGDAGDPLTDDELIEKAVDCFSYGKCTRSAQEFAAKVFAMSDATIDSVLKGLH